MSSVDAQASGSRLLTVLDRMPWEGSSRCLVRLTLSLMVAFVRWPAVMLGTLATGVDLSRAKAVEAEALSQSETLFETWRPQTGGRGRVQYRMGTDPITFMVQVRERTTPSCRNARSQMPRSSVSTCVGRVRITRTLASSR